MQLDFESLALEVGGGSGDGGTGDRGSSPAWGWMEAGLGTVGRREGSPGMGCGRPGRRPPTLATRLDPIKLL